MREDRVRIDSAIGAVPIPIRTIHIWVRIAIVHPIPVPAIPPVAITILIAVRTMDRPIIVPVVRLIVIVVCKSGL